MTRPTNAACRTSRLALAALASALAAACGTSLDSADAPDTNDMRERRIEEMGSIFGEGGISFGGEREDAGTEGGIGVNSFLWRGTLDTLSFMPITSADPFGGVILTDWYSPSGTDAERFKVNVYILDRQLRADGVRVAVFRQVRDGNGGWTDAAVSEDTASRLEETILTRARELRVQSSSTG